MVEKKSSAGDAALERAKKQQYLVEHIQSKGYDTTTFANFMATKKEGGGDVDVWNLEELKDVSKSQAKLY